METRVDRVIMVVEKKSEHFGVVDQDVVGSGPAPLWLADLLEQTLDPEVGVVLLFLLRNPLELQTRPRSLLPIGEALDGLQVLVEQFHAFTVFGLEELPAQGTIFGLAALFLALIHRLKSALRVRSLSGNKKRPFALLLLPLQFL